MQDFIQALINAFTLISQGDVRLRETISLSFYVSLTSLSIASLIGLPLGCLLAVTRFPTRQIIIVIANSCMGFPPVVMGLIIYLLLSRGGALGALQLLYTPHAMIIAQTLLVLPVIVSLAHRVIEDLYQEYNLLLKTLRTRLSQTIAILLWDARYSMLTVLLAGFGRAISEVGAMLIVGGNIAHITRVMTTSIALETSKGNLALALSLGIVLLLTATAVNATLFTIRSIAKHYDYA